MIVSKGRNVIVAGLMLVLLAGCSVSKSDKSSSSSSQKSSKVVKSSSKVTRSSSKSASSAVQDEPKTHATLKLTFMGDNTLGTDPKFNASTSLPTVWAQHGNDPSYFFQNVASYFRSDDLTVANLETTLTNSSTQKFKGTGTVFHFKGNPGLVKVLTGSSIEAVTVANNHIYDYGQQGFSDTIATLKAAGVGYTGEGYQYVTKIKGVLVGILGYQGWTATSSDQHKIKTDIKNLRKKGCQIVIPYFHWGIERSPYPNATQTTLAHTAIDAGADMVIGSHPHVIESMEKYKGKLIAYSMSNFCFGGNSHPSDMRSFILQANVTVSGSKVSAVSFRAIPTRISATESYNNYQPTPYTGSSAAAVLSYMNSLSPTLHGAIRSQFTAIK
ncbi:CapA family protein [Lacticaseibacillus hulanensis]|uniref:CapA family protein n=1 Tax=Lacticaseibacillus hulanensis TaxID=2493111 RepID=UPI000FDB3724|nr:CapA family protein [Lacticaseibacillus hulanensis]